MLSEFMSQCYHDLSYSYIFMHVFLRLCYIVSYYCSCIWTLAFSLPHLHTSTFNVLMHLRYGVLYHRFRSTSSWASLVDQTFSSQTSSESLSFEDSIIILLLYYFSSSELVGYMSHQLYSSLDSERLSDYNMFSDSLLQF